MQFFFYGTLMDPDVRDVVVPHVAGRLRTQPAVLPGYRRATCGNLPVLVRRTGGRVDGLLLEGLDAAALLRIAYFEGEEYVPWPEQVVDAEGHRCRAWLFLPNHDYAAGERWSFARWQRLHKRRLIRQTQAWMAQFGSSNMRSLDVPWHVRRRIHSLLTPTPLSSGPLATALRDQELDDLPPLRVAAGSRRY